MKPAPPSTVRPLGEDQLVGLHPTAPHLWEGGCSFLFQSEVCHLCSHLCWSGWWLAAGNSWSNTDILNMQANLTPEETAWRARRISGTAVAVVSMVRKQDIASYTRAPPCLCDDPSSSQDVSSTKLAMSCNKIKPSMFRLQSRFTRLLDLVANLLNSWDVLLLQSENNTHTPPRVKKAVPTLSFQH